MTGVWQLLAVSLVEMGLSHTIARERIFEPVRTRLGGKDTWLGYLVSCPYCVSRWIALILVPLTGTYAVNVVPRWGVLSDAIRLVLSSILVAVLAAFFRVIFYFVDESQGLGGADRRRHPSRAGPHRRCRPSRRRRAASRSRRSRSSRRTRRK